MKVRCKKCGNIVKVNLDTSNLFCPECGEQIVNPSISESQYHSENIKHASIQPQSGSKGNLPIQDTKERNIGCLIMGILLFGITFLIALITEGDDLTYWVLAIIAFTALIPLGIWFEKNTVKKRGGKNE